MIDERKQEEQVQDSTGGIWSKMLEWTGWADALQDEKERMQMKMRLDDAKEWINMPYKQRMEMVYEKGGKHGENLSSSEVVDPNSLRWFIYNLDGNDKKEVRILQEKLNEFFDEHGWKLESIPTDGDLGNRTISRMQYFMNQYDKHYNTEMDTKESIRAAEELIFYRNDPFTEESDTMRIKENLQNMRPNKEVEDILKNLNMIKQ